MKRGPQHLSIFLVLCIALAGVVGLSPKLHVFVEHGGRGAVHTHRGADGLAYSHEDVHWPAPGKFKSAIPSPAERSLAKTNALTFFGLQPQDVVRICGRLIAKAVGQLPTAPSHGGEGHTHHSLAQLLLNGTVEGADVTPNPVVAPEQFAFVSFPFDSRLVAAHWYAPTASRGPPLGS